MTPDPKAGEPAGPATGPIVPAGPATGPIVPGRPRKPQPPLSYPGLALIGAAVMVAFVLTSGVFLPAIRELAAGARRPATSVIDPATLPLVTTACNRDWHRGDPATVRTSADVAARTGDAPLVITTGLLPGCPSGACTDTAVGACSTVVYVLAGPDVYVEYELVGGP